MLRWQAVNHTNSRSIPLLAARIALGGVALCCVWQPVAAVDEETATSKNFAYYTFVERTGRATVLVDSYLAMKRRGEPYVPLQIAVGLYPAKDEDGKRTPRTVRVLLDDLTLVDAAENTVGPAGYEEIRKGYERLDADYGYVRQNPINTGELFRNSHRVGAEFYPTGYPPRMRTRRVELWAYSWFRDTIYFHAPADGLDGILTLQLRIDGDEQPVEVRFRVPAQKPPKTADENEPPAKPPVD
jgi:hypothetical protein